MTDTISVAERSLVMGRVRSKNTRPEMIVRRLVFHEGYRYQLHGRGLPGKPDLVFAGRRKVIFVHGCFWHRHEGCPLARIPKSNQEFWLNKLEGNRKRDLVVMGRLQEGGWAALIIWECELKDPKALAERVKTFLGPIRAKPSLR